MVCLLATKLYIPPPRPNLVVRPRLFERLNEGLHRKLTLVSAPTGFGKTTLISSWIADLPAAATSQGKIANRLAWPSLDEGDNNPTHFLAYLVAALQTVLPTLGEGLLYLLQSPQPPPIEALLTTLPGSSSRPCKVS